MGLARSPLAPETLPSLPPIAGVELATTKTNLRYKDRLDLLLMRFAAGTSVAGVFTQSTTAAAPVDACRRALAQGEAAALLVNAGNANAFTGQVGDEAVTECQQAVANALSCDAGHVFIASTGVIGQPLKTMELCSFIPELAASLSPQGWDNAADAIRTTDTFPKLATRQAEIDGITVTINGIAKGSGMIAPNMATMLGFVATDAAIPQDVLQAALQECNEVSFNSITVDSDTSTNDTLLAFATGQAGNAMPSTLHDPILKPFRDALHEVLVELAQLIVRDGEGASKFITVNVSGATTQRSARIMALAIANSPLIKTAIAGEDANWGRIVMAIGKTGEPLEREHISIAIGGTIIARDGGVIPGYDETPVAAYMKGREIDITVEVGKGVGQAMVWTCDLTHGYIAINADYRS